MTGQSLYQAYTVYCSVHYSADSMHGYIKIGTIAFFLIDCTFPFRIEFGRFFGVVMIFIWFLKGTWRLEKVFFGGFLWEAENCKSFA